MYGAWEEDGICGGGDMIKEIVKGLWQFCSYLFVPQWGRNQNKNNVRHI